MNPEYKRNLKYVFWDHYYSKLSTLVIIVSLIILIYLNATHY